jgi:hypothetical protein
MDAQQSIDALEQGVTRWLEVTLMPIMIAFVAGMLVMDWHGEQLQAERMGVLMREAAQARRELAQAERHLVLYDQVCAPLLSMPLEQAPEILHTDDAVNAPPATMLARVGTPEMVR